MRTAILIPCYNEEATVGKVVSDFRRVLPEATVYVYDNNSQDNTAQVARDAGAVVVPEYRQGKGFVVRSMFRGIDADCYVMVDGDDTYPAEDVPPMVALIEEGKADMVVGDRLSSTYFEENARRMHGFGNRLVRFLVNSIFQSSIRDVMTGCRCFSRTFVKSFPVTSSGFEIETEMTVHALDRDFLVRELPVTYRDRPEGSVSKLRTYSDGLRVLRTILLLFRDYRPMSFFGLGAAALFLVALIMFLPPLNEYVRGGYVRRVPTLVVSIALGISALLSLASGIILDAIRTHSRQFYELELNALALNDRRSQGDT
ncbi:MAG: glycosyltransferase family 2 protein [Coriobacteriia bacterium]|nr:glycosyltransferase family 2 protein [Coriobacteriia bacterium]